MLCIFEYHVDGFILENDLFQSDNILMRYLLVQLCMQIGVTLYETTEHATHSDLPNGALANPRVRDHIALLVRLELLDSMHSSTFLLADCFVHPAVRSRRYETQDGVLVAHTPTSTVPFRTVEAHGVLLEHVLRSVVE